MMKKTILLLIAILSIYACQKDDIGYLQVDGAGYKPDSLIVRTELQDKKAINQEYIDCLELGYTESELAEMQIYKYIYEPDYFRTLKKVPWTSTEIEGVRGTAQIFYKIINIKGIDGSDANKYKEYMAVDGAGRISVIYDHKVPKGKYLISLEIKNEGYTKYLNDILTVIVK